MNWNPDGETEASVDLETPSRRAGLPGTWLLADLHATGSI